MRKAMFSAVFIVVALALQATGAIVAAGEELELPPKLRAALVEEMRAVQREMQRVAVALPQGDWAALHDAASRIEGSYLLKRKLSPGERETLHLTLPDAFKRLDAAFHEHAQRLAQATVVRDPELSLFYVSRLNDGCIACHSRFAAQRFPGFHPASTPHAH